MRLDYEGESVDFSVDGWFNATTVGARSGKKPHEWLRLPDTQDYLAAVERKYGKIPYLKTKRGRGGGTWMHPKLAVRFAQWLDMDFAVWCDEQIDHILRGGLHMMKSDSHVLSTTPDREPLLTVAAAIVARHRLPFGPVYEALDNFVGVAHARDMDCKQVNDAAQFGARLLAGNATSADFERIASNRERIGRPAMQLSLIDAAGGVR
ncbi:DNA-binding protein [Burkholderia sp. SRS-W-2-2016]|nr:DNA-binding protein [Burkholderia sp. SRS-W-2-2016]